MDPTLWMRSAPFELRAYYPNFTYLTASLLTEVEFFVAGILQEIFPDTKSRDMIQKLISELNVWRAGEVPQ
jgi:hypothetical protein